MAFIQLNNLVCDPVKQLKAYHVDTVDCAIKLHANENPFSPPEIILDQLRQALENQELNRYPDPECKSLRAAIAARLQVAPEQIVVGNGSDEIIQLLMAIFCSPGDCLAYPDPTFAMYGILSKSMGIEPLAVPLNESWDLEAPSFLKAIEEKNPRLVFFSYPNNPTGNCFNEQAIQEIIEQFEGIVVVDEAYFDFSQKTFIRQLEKHNNLVILRSLSKIGLAGLRVGYGIADPYIIEQINKVRLPYNSNTLTQLISEFALKNFSQIQGQVDTIIDERSRMVQELAKIPSISVFATDSNFILFRSPLEDKVIFNRLAERGILVRDLSAHPRLKGCVRVTVGSTEENNEFLTQMNSLLAKP